jgi:predicted peptidase
MQKLSRIGSALLAFALMANAIHAEDNAPSPGKQVSQKLALDSGGELRYWLFVPRFYDTAKVDFPLIVFLHGAGERGDDLAVVKKHGPPKLVETNGEFRFIVASPQVEKDGRWKPEDVAALIDHLSKTLKVDKSRVYLTGLSMGGAGTWNTAVKYGDKLAAIVPICGRGDLNAVEKIKDLPTWVFVGAKDREDLVQGNDDIVAALKKAGGSPKYTVYPDAGHDSWTVTYDNPELYKWLLEQKRK